MKAAVLSLLDIFFLTQFLFLGCREEVEDHPKIHLRLFPKPSQSHSYISKMWYLMSQVLPILMFDESKVDLTLMQIPPSLPTMLLSFLQSLLKGNILGYFLPSYFNTFY